MRTHSKVKGYCTERSAHLGTASGLINSLIQLREGTQACVCVPVCVRACVCVSWGNGFLHYLHKSDLKVAISHVTATNNRRAEIHYSKQVTCLGWLSICKQRGIRPKIGLRLTGNNSTCQRWCACKWNICITLTIIHVAHYVESSIQQTGTANGKGERMNFQQHGNPAGEALFVTNSTLFRLNEQKVGMGPINTNDYAVSPCLFNVNRRHLTQVWHSYKAVRHKDLLGYL